MASKPRRLGEMTHSTTLSMEPDSELCYVQTDFLKVREDLQLLEHTERPENLLNAQPTPPATNWRLPHLRMRALASYKTTPRYSILSNGHYVQHSVVAAHSPCQKQPIHKHVCQWTTLRSTHRQARNCWHNPAHNGVNRMCARVSSLLQFDVGNLATVQIKNVT